MSEDSYLIHQSPSGYNDQAGWRLICQHLVEWGLPIRPLYIFVDGEPPACVCVAECMCVLTHAL
eukprot:229730-Rhodomonas_salina.1